MKNWVKKHYFCYNETIETKIMYKVNHEKDFFPLYHYEKNRQTFEVEKKIVQRKVGLIETLLLIQLTTGTMNMYKSSNEKTIFFSH